MARNFKVFYQIVQLKNMADCRTFTEKIADQPVYLQNGMSIHITVSLGVRITLGQVQTSNNYRL
ncbi:hypothetical protein ACEQPO_06965 [Bacillus sp. SL00103]